MIHHNIKSVNGDITNSSSIYLKGQQVTPQNILFTPHHLQAAMSWYWMSSVCLSRPILYISHHLSTLWSWEADLYELVWPFGIQLG